MFLTTAGEDAGHTAPKKRRPASPEEFFTAVDVGHPEAVQGLVFEGLGGKPNDHLYCSKGEDFGAWAAKKAGGRKPAYFTMAAFAPDAVSRFKGRMADNVVALRGLWIDVEGCPEKYARNPQGGYPDLTTALRETAGFCKVTGLIPNFLMLTGNGGIHLHCLLSEHVSPAVWLPRSRALVKLAVLHHFKIDAQCTIDAARIMRGAGSLHQKTGQEVQAIAWRVEPYSLAEFDALVNYTPEAIEASEPAARAGRTLAVDINADVLGAHPQFSYQQAAARCGAIALAAKDNGRGTPYPVWILAARTASLSVEGREYAHEISQGDERYEAGETDKKIDSLTGGPASCEAWSNAWGAGGPCDTCEFRGKLKNPAVQLGTLVETSPPGVLAVAAAGDSAALPQWLASMNDRFAVVRVGSKLVVMDFATPGMSGRGVTRSMGVLDVAGLRAMLNGRFIPPEKPGDRPRPLADAWLSHLARRQYEGLVFAPGGDVPADILNLWHGFDLEPMAGDVSPWLEVLQTLVPSEAERRYVLRWLAWKVQNPAGVPDTVVIFQGAKGTGKNSLLDPIVLIFGRYAMLADDPELIAGRFTWHLMTLCLAVLDEAVFIGDPRQADRIKSRVTGKTMMYEQKGMDPVQGVNRCAYVMLTNHSHVWQATTDERRAVVIEVGEALRGNLEFWKRYHAWIAGDGPAALLHHLQNVDLTGFNPRDIPKGEALRRQIEMTALRDPAAAWWNHCLNEGQIRWRDGLGERVVAIGDDTETEIDRAGLRLSYEQSAGNRGRVARDWAAVSKRVRAWAGLAGMHSVRPRTGESRAWREVLAPLPRLREAFTATVGVRFDE